jgi:rfaE bifunctional protein nucleotidyltransferase chain/domain
VTGFQRAAADLEEAAVRITQCLRQGGKLLVFGNGGSAAQAQHLAGELLGRYRDEREGLPAMALAADGAVVTGLANDFGFGSVFARQIEALGRPGDVAVAISTSGTSPSTVAGAAAARDRGLGTVGMIGTSTSPLHGLVDVAIVTPAPTPARVQELQLVACHVVCEMVERALFPQTADGDRPVERGILTVPELLGARERWRELGQSVVWTNGCFDLLHAGHVRMLRAARALGDIFVVGVNDDEGVRRLKGPGRPVVPLEDRLEILLALETVDRVVVLEDDDPVSLLAELRPDVHCKGGDYGVAARPMPERTTVEGAGGVVHVLDYWEGRSTTAIVDRIEGRRPHGR